MFQRQRKWKGSYLLRHLIVKMQGLRKPLLNKQRKSNQMMFHLLWDKQINIGAKTSFEKNCFSAWASTLDMYVGRELLTSKFISLQQTRTFWPLHR